MAAETKRCTLIWKIKNFSNCWWLKTGERLESPVFVVDGRAETKWSLWLYPKGVEDNIGLYLHRELDSGTDVIERVQVDLKFLRKDSNFNFFNGTCRFFSKNSKFGDNRFDLRRRNHLDERETFQTFLFQDTLSIECTIRTDEQYELASETLFATTVVKTKRRSFAWKIIKTSATRSSITQKLKDSLIDFDVSLNLKLNKLSIYLISFHHTIKYISCYTSVIDWDGRKKTCGIIKCFSSDFIQGDKLTELVLPKMELENKRQYRPHEFYSLNFEFVLATAAHFGDGGVEIEEKLQNMSVLISDFKKMYDYGTLSDVELRTSTKTFPVHKNILSARSPVFRSMFTSDMKEKNCGFVDITDVDADTVHRMLLYIYTDKHDDLKFEKASKLYAAADKYQILSLKGICSSLLKKELNSKNAYEALILADLRSDDDLKSYVEDYLLGQPEQAYQSEEWKDFMSTHLELAADLMYRKITNLKEIKLPRKRKASTLRK